MGNLESSASMARIARELAAARALLASAPAPLVVKAPRAQRGASVAPVLLGVALAVLLGAFVVQGTSTLLGELAQAVEVRR